jgi:hypothetical protein
MTLVLLCSITCNNTKQAKPTAPMVATQSAAPVDWSHFYATLDMAQKLNDSMYRVCKARIKKEKPPVVLRDHPEDIGRAVDY